MTLQNHTQLYIHLWCQSSEHVMTFHKTMQNRPRSHPLPSSWTCSNYQNLSGANTPRIQRDATGYGRVGSKQLSVPNELLLYYHITVSPYVVFLSPQYKCSPLLIFTSVTIFSNGSLNTYSFSTFLWVTSFCLLLSNYQSLKTTVLPVHCF